MASKEERDRLIGEIVKFLYDNNVHQWPIQDKGVLVGAIKLQLEENTRMAAQAAPNV